MSSTYFQACDLLRAELRRAARSMGADSCAVVDASGGLFCSSPPTDAVAEAAERFLEKEMNLLAKPLHRGGRLAVARPNAGPDAQNVTDPAAYDSYAAESFAGLYIVVFWFLGSFGVEIVGARIKAALPKIEALTLALPPPEGPSTTEGARRVFTKRS